MKIKKKINGEFKKRWELKLNTEEKGSSKQKKTHLAWSGRTLKRQGQRKKRRWQTDQEHPREEDGKTEPTVVNKNRQKLTTGRRGKRAWNGERWEVLLWWGIQYLSCSNQKIYNIFLSFSPKEFYFVFASKKRTDLISHFFENCCIRYVKFKQKWFPFIWYTKHSLGHIHHNSKYFGISLDFIFNS